MNKLQELEVNELNEVMQEEVTNFKVDSIEKANWVFRKIKALQENITQNNNLAEQEFNRIQAWKDKENKPLEDSIEYLSSLVKGYFINLRAEDPKAKLSTPYGKISTRKNTSWEYEEETVLTYLASNGYEELIRVKKEVDKANLKKVFKNGVNTETGEVLPGVQIEEVESINVKVE